MDLGKGTGKTNTHAGIIRKLKTGPIFWTVNLTNAKFLKFFWISAVRYTHGRTCVYKRYAPGTSSSSSRQQQQQQQQQQQHQQQQQQQQQQFCSSSST